MLRLIQIGQSLPCYFPVDKSATFLPGQIAQLNVIGNTVKATVSNGIAPIGIIDDVKTQSFSSVSWNEQVIVPAVGVLNSSNQFVTAVDIKAELKEPNIIRSSFTSSIPCVLNEKNGVITFVAGTPLNCDMTGEGSLNAIKAIVNYTYEVSSVIGDDSTLGNNRVTIWFQRMFVATDQFETNQSYPVGANLFVSEGGLLTSRRPSNIHPSIGMVTGPPSPMNPFLELLWL